MENISFEDFMANMNTAQNKIKSIASAVTFENKDVMAQNFDPEFPGFDELRHPSTTWDPYWEISDAKLLAKWLYTQVYMAHDEDFDHFDAQDDEENFAQLESLLEKAGF
jgi:hypothetical protein